MFSCYFPLGHFLGFLNFPTFRPQEGIFPPLSIILLYKWIVIKFRIYVTWHPTMKFISIFFWSSSSYPPGGVSPPLPPVFFLYKYWPIVLNFGAWSPFLEVDHPPFPWGGDNATSSPRLPQVIILFDWFEIRSACSVTSKKWNSDNRFLHFSKSFPSPVVPQGEGGNSLKFPIS